MGKAEAESLLGDTGIRSTAVPETKSRSFSRSTECRCHWRRLRLSDANRRDLTKSGLRLGLRLESWKRLIACTNWGLLTQSAANIPIISQEKT